jgi:cell division protein FtsB
VHEHLDPATAALAIALAFTAEQQQQIEELEARIESLEANSQQLNESTRKIALYHLYSNSGEDYIGVIGQNTGKYHDSGYIERIPN